MKLDEFSFFNQQLGAMLREGLPIEGALRELAAGMERGALRDELTLLGNDLAGGAPLAEAIGRRDLPDLYKRMVMAGAQGNNLPGVLALLADYYQQRNNTLNRLKGLMIYPFLVLGFAFVVSGGIAIAWSCYMAPAFREIFSGLGEGRPLPAFTQMMMNPVSTMLIPPVIIGGLLLAALAIAYVPSWRKAIRWRLPAFKETNLAQCAATVNLLLRSGATLPDALGLVAQVEGGTQAGQDLNLWRSRITTGMAKFSEVAQGSRAFPPLFIWMVANTGTEIAGGFERASNIYRARAAHRTEMLLYAALPACVLVLGMIVLSQASWVMSALLPLMDMLGNMGGGD